MELTGRAIKRRREELPADPNVEQYNPFKVHIIGSKIPDGTSTTVYRCGPMIDLCVGPHIPHTGRVKSMAILKVC